MLLSYLHTQQCHKFNFVTYLEWVLQLLVHQDYLGLATKYSYISDQYCVRFILNNNVLFHMLMDRKQQHIHKNNATNRDIRSHMTHVIAL